jgi:pimeloyl-ACP methyl ester carboxylesterase
MTAPTIRNASARRQLQVGDLQFDVLIAGNGPLVLLLHGFPESSRSWRAQVQALAEAGYTAVAPDLRGYGGSSKPSRVEDYALTKSVGDVAGIADALGASRFAVVGHDWGGGLAWQTALALPERVAAVFVLSIPFMPRSPAPPDPAFALIPRETFFYIRYFQEIGRPEHELNRDVKHSLKTLYWAASGDAPLGQWQTPKQGGAGILDDQTPPTGDLTWLTDAEVAACAVAFEGAGFGPPLNWFCNLLRNWQETEGLAGQTVKQPAGFMVGEKDISLLLTRDAVRAITANVPDLRVNLTLPGVGHWTQQEASAIVNEALLAFLDGVSIDRRAGTALSAPATQVTPSIG